MKRVTQQIRVNIHIVITYSFSQVCLNLTKYHQHFDEIRFMEDSVGRLSVRFQYEFEGDILTRVWTKYLPTYQKKSTSAPSSNNVGLL